jgi:TonB family protein
VKPETAVSAIPMKIFQRLIIILFATSASVFVACAQSETKPPAFSQAVNDYYQSIHDKIMAVWHPPGEIDGSTVNPIVRIHVNRDGSVPPDEVVLVRSSGNKAIDAVALDAARKLNSLPPLPSACKPDIPITFNLRI